MKGIKDLISQKVHIKVGHEVITLLPISLRRELEIEEVYGGVGEMVAMLETDGKRIFEFIHFFTDRKLSLDEIKFLLLSNAEKNSGGEYRDAVVKIIKNSRPEVKNLKRHKEMAKILEATQDRTRELTYADYFDRISSRYPINLDQFLELTLRQVQTLIKSSDAGRLEDLKIRASLAGKELKEPMQFNEISEEEDEDQDAEARKMYERLKAEARGKK